MVHGSWFMAHGSWFRAREPSNLPPTWRVRRIWGDPRITMKSYQISSQSPGQQKSWKLFLRHSKSWKTAPGIIRNPTSVKVGFRNSSNAKCLVLESQTSRFRPKNRQKRNLETTINRYTFLVQDTRKAVKTGTRNPLKSREIEAWPPKCYFLWAWVPQDRPRLMAKKKIGAGSPRPRALAPIFSWTWAVSLEQRALRQEPWALSHGPGTLNHS